MAVERIPDHADQASARLAFQFQQKPRIEALVRILTGEVQALEDALHGLIAGRTLQQATGSTLARWGAALGRPRPASGSAATNDEAYRALLFAQALAHSSSGTSEDVLSLLRLLGAVSARLTEPAPATLGIDFSGSLIPDGATLKTLLRVATAPIALDHVHSAASPPFGFAGNPDASGFGAGKLGRSI